MSQTISALDRDEWGRLELEHFSAFAHRISAVNVGHGRASYGEWFFAPDEPQPVGRRVIYSGCWGEDIRLGDPAHSRAEVFDPADPDELAEFSLSLKNWESQPDFDQQPNALRV